MTTSRHVSVAAAIAGTLTLAISTSCASPGAPDRRTIHTWPSAVPRNATVDPHTGGIALPLDWFSVSALESRTIDYAVNLLLADCMEEAGYHLEAVDTTKSPVEASRRYGIWHEAEANRYGYDPVPPTAEQRRLQEMNSRPLSTAAEARHGTCMASPAIQELNLPMPFFKEPEFAMYRATIESDQGQRLVQGWRQCLKTEGIATSDGYDDMWTPVHATGPDKTLRRIATADVRCKSQLNLVAGLADLESVAQATYIQRELTALLQYRQQVDAALSVASRIVSDRRHGN
jgi:hypothetical protein